MPTAKMIKYGRTRYKSKEHPLYTVWRNIRNCYDCAEVWVDFETFCADVGTRPHRHDLKRLCTLLPFGPDNWRWKRRLL